MSSFNSLKTPSTGSSPHSKNPPKKNEFINNSIISFNKKLKFYLLKYYKLPGKAQHSL